MIWLDIIDPKYALFFRPLLPLLRSKERVLITTRKSAGYDECARLLELFGIESIAIGGYGGADKLGKFEARLQRQAGFLELFRNLGELPRLFITGASVDGTQCAYGLGIPIVQFADTPIAGERFALESLTILSRLCLPLSALVFAPFVVPRECYRALGLLDSQVVSYDFIDVAAWLGGVAPHSELGSADRAAFYERFGFESGLPLVLVREEEYKAHYVKQRLDVVYESIERISARANVLLMPRYESDYLLARFGALRRVKILESKLEPALFYPHIDVLLGGGGTMNLEACYLGIPTISARSLLLFHDRFLLEHGLMRHAHSSDEVLAQLEEILSTRWAYERKDRLFAPNGVRFEPLLERIWNLV